ncbi:MAG: hypothetical protein JST51_17900 [Armatimonadetes bacterium]|nr:hypothetical protein [Armatimonadota bacterium]
MTKGKSEALHCQREYFSILDEFFRSVTGKSAQDFSTVEDFGDTLLANVHALVSRLDCYSTFEDNLKQYHEKRSIELYDQAKRAFGRKLILGGGSRFLNSQLKSVVVNSLYSDVIIVPDPVLPWLEQERKEERFRHVQLLEAVHTVLYLKPLIDAEINQPPILVFPSFEKIMENLDEQTKRNQSKFLSRVIFGLSQQEHTSFSEIIESVNTDPSFFLDRIESEGLLIAPGDSISLGVTESLKRYEESISRTRTEEWMQTYESAPLELRVLNAVLERYAPFYHLLENSLEFGASPLVSVPGQVACFSKVSEVFTLYDTGFNFADTKTKGALDILQSKPLEWLTNISVDSLASLRAEGEIEQFRKLLSGYISEIENANPNSAERVAGEFAVHLENLIAKHNQELLRINAKYGRSHGQSLFIAVAGLLLNFVPIINVPLTPIAAVAAIAKFGKDKADQGSEVRDARRSFVGVLSQTKRSTNEP